MRRKEALVGHALRIADQQPIIEMNTTPLIDVMLVLLVMFIITIPVQTHAVKLELPAPCDSCPIPNSLRNEIVVTREGATLWNGVPVPMDGIKYELALTRRMKPAPELHLRPDAAARYEAVDQLLGVIKREGITKVGFVGNEAYAIR